MPWVPTVTIAGVVLLAVLIWVLIRTYTKDKLAELMAKRKPTSKIVSRAEYVEGIELMPVALSLTADTLYYENPDLQASFELKNIDEIEYDDELATGKSLAHGARALRLRSHGRTIEFVLDPSQAKPWESMLPPQRAGQPTARAS